jgi:prophage tail gpP-like protein
VSVANRAQWKWQRGQFDSWTYEITVKGHSQNGIFYAPDTICEVNDTVFGISGKRFYVAAVRFSRTMQGGTTTTLRIHKADVLGA